MKQQIDTSMAERWLDPDTFVYRGKVYRINPNGKIGGDKMRITCECKVISMTGIEYCPKHKAAPAMYKATKIALDLVKTVLYEHPDDEIAKEQKKVIDKALALAGGK